LRALVPRRLVRRSRSRSAELGAPLALLRGFFFGGLGVLGSFAGLDGLGAFADLGSDFGFLEGWGE